MDVRFWPKADMSIVLSRRGGCGNIEIAMVFLSKGPTAGRY